MQKKNRYEETNLEGKRGLEEDDVIDDPVVFETDLSSLEPLTSNGHQWHQEGPYLICESCTVRHSSFIGIENVLSGFTEDGQPIIKKRF